MSAPALPDLDRRGRRINRQKKNGPEGMAKKVARQLIAAPAEGCVDWPNKINSNGYGTAHLDGQAMTAHRAVYILTVGPIPDGLHLDHLCRNRACVNPAHLEPVTPRENVLRYSRLISHCKQGHPYDEVNTVITSRGWRACRVCRIARDRARRSRARGGAS